MAASAPDTLQSFPYSEAQKCVAVEAHPEARPRPRETAATTHWAPAFNGLYPLCTSVSSVVKPLTLDSFRRKAYKQRNELSRESRGRYRFFDGNRRSHRQAFCR